MPYRLAIAHYYNLLLLSVLKNKKGWVVGLEPTYPAWKAGVLPLNYTRKVGVTGFEPATSWSQTRRSSQAEPHPAIFTFVFNDKSYSIEYPLVCQVFFYSFLYLPESPKTFGEFVS